MFANLIGENEFSLDTLHLLDLVNLNILNMIVVICISFLVMSLLGCSLPISTEVFHFFS